MKPTSSKAAIELFHLILLDFLGRKADRKHWVLKGGCNLRFFMKSIRYSEDMDLDIGPGLPKDKLGDLVERLLGSKSFCEVLALRGLRLVEHSSPKQTETTQRWKFGLAQSRGTALLRTKIEFSRHELDEGIAFGPVDSGLSRTYEMTPVFATHYTPQAALDQKVRALASRREVQARDIFDLDLLLNSGVRPSAHSHKWREQARENAFALTFEIFKAQVVSYLAPEAQKVFGAEDVWDALVLRVVGALEESS